MGAPLQPAAAAHALVRFPGVAPLRCRAGIGLAIFVALGAGSARATGTSVPKRPRLLLVTPLHRPSPVGGIFPGVSRPDAIFPYVSVPDVTFPGVNSPDVISLGVNAQSVCGWTAGICAFPSSSGV